MDSRIISNYVAGTYANTAPATLAAAADASAASDAEQAVSEAINASADKTLDAFVTQVLKEAGIVKNERTMNLVKLLVEQHQPVNKETIGMYNRLMAQNPGVDIQTLIIMHKNNIDITSAMLIQFDNYKANEHQLMRELDVVANNLSEVIDVLMNEDASKASELLKGLDEFVQNMTRETGELHGLYAGMGETQGLYDGVGEAKGIYSGTGESQGIGGMSGQQDVTVYSSSNQVNSLIGQNDGVTGQLGGTDSASNFVNQSVRITDRADGMAGETYGIVEQLSSENQANSLTGQTESVASNIIEQSKSINQATDVLKQLLATVGKQAEAKAMPDDISKDFFSKVAQLINESSDDVTNAKILGQLSTDDFKRTAREILREAILLSPEEVADKEELKEYYRKLKASTDKLIDVMNNLGDKAADSAVANSMRKMSDNVTFMNQVNAYMPYVQLPLKLIKEEAHGDFYVYKRNKKDIKNNETLTAVLKLSMKHLGKLDVFVKLRDKALNIEFKCEKKEITAFIEQRLEGLEERLKTAGYLPNIDVSDIRNDSDKEFDFTRDFLESGSDMGEVSRYSFDMKA
ncbi:MAG: flagellar hook-length control protein FliK [Lachnospiraceae bacterium]|nr:flagellar hook-length control protein FliK [Lachnospiraceae bacterium]